MKWNELQEKAKVKLLCDLRIVVAEAVTNDFVTPGQLDMVAPIAHKAGAVFTIYQVDVPEGWPVQTELFNECTDQVILFDSLSAVPAHFQVI